MPQLLQNLPVTSYTALLTTLPFRSLSMSRIFGSQYSTTPKPTHGPNAEAFVPPQNSPTQSAFFGFVFNTPQTRRQRMLCRAKMSMARRLSTLSYGAPPPAPSRRVVVTGLGAVTPFGVGVQRSWDALLDSQCAIRVRPSLVGCTY